MPQLCLNCLVLGDTQDHIFSVKIASTDTVSLLREAIKDKKKHAFHDVDADQLVLYRTSLDDNELKNKLESINFDEPLRSLSILAEVFPDPLAGHVHVVVRRPLAGGLSSLFIFLYLTWI